MVAAKYQIAQQKELLIFFLERNRKSCFVKIGMMSRLRQVSKLVREESMAVQ